MRWEYEVFYFAYGALNPDEFAETMADWLNASAQNGWELVAVVPREGRGETIYVRRRIQ
jgi:hypothetical protein